VPYPPDDKLTLLPFPQRWDGARILLRAVVLPRGSPLVPLVTGVPGVADGPAFADADVRLKAMLIPSLDRLPDPADVTAQVELGAATPPDKRDLFEAVGAQFQIDPAVEAGTKDPRRAGRQFKKFLPPSYTQAFPFAGTRTPFAVLDDSYACALRRGCVLRKPPGPPPSPKTSWGRVIAQALRQPLLAERLGLIYADEVVLPDPGLFANGGWLYLALTDASAYAAHVAARPELLARYAARLPALGAARGLFSSVLFPVTSTPPPGNFDEVFAEAADYDDGFAKVVHAAQQTTAEPIGLEESPRAREGPPPAALRDTGVELGWDDEQLVVWMNRQIADPAVETRQSPMAVRGFRVDVREAGAAAWVSMMQVEADLAVGGRDVGHFEGEMNVEVGAIQPDNQEDGDYWMSAYFARWLGRSLVTPDTVALRLSGQAAPAGGDYQPVGDDAVPLRYGRTYEFRIRLADLSGGSPDPGDDPANPAPAPVATCPFRRHVPPREVLVGGVPNPPDPLNPPDTLQVARPRLGYPAAVFAGVPNAVADLLAEADQITATGQGDVPSVPDPDVDTLEITLQVAGLEFDSANDERGPPPLRNVYTTTRPFPADPAQPLDLDLEYADVADVAGLAAPAAGPLPVPRARDVVLRLRAVGRADPGLAYFGSQQARLGDFTSVRLRAAPQDERDLFAPDTPANRFRCILLQPDEASTGSLLVKLRSAGRGEQAETDALHRLAGELGLDAAGEQGLTLSGRPGRRTAFGCSKAIPHVLAPDGSAVTFASKADLTARWLAVIRLTLDRDWTWDGAADPAVEVTRVGAGVVGGVRLPRSVNPTVYEGPEAAGRQADRSATDLVFLDAIDPKPVPPAHPRELHLEYTLMPRFRQAPAASDQPLRVEIRLPVAAPPTQTPRLVSAGIALAPYVRAPDYSSTERRERLLWVEFDRPPEDPADACFGRVLSYAPDPLLTGGVEVAPPPEPPLPTDPEPIRVIHPGQSDDRAGLSAMQQLLPTTSPRHFLVPLPPGLQQESRELFGFFVYEFRVGHLREWSTARARYGPPLRVTGVQHPCPPLDCEAARTPEELLVSATFATPVFDGRGLLPPTPATVLWALLYTQVTQVDGADRRNVLIGRKQGWFTREKYRRREEVDLAASVRWSRDEVVAALGALGLPGDSPLSVLAVELVPEAERVPDPVGTDLGQVRILRTSTLVPVPQVCPPAVCPP
jgi:hypothetical protein